MQTQQQQGSRMRTYMEFTLEAAHSVTNFSRLHGHTFVVKLSFEGEPEATTGWVANLYEVRKLAERIRATIGAPDENGDGAGEGCLNDIEGLQVVSLENFAKWIWSQVTHTQPNLESVEVSRGFRGSIEGCEYKGPGDRASVLARTL